MAEEVQACFSVSFEIPGNDLDHMTKLRSAGLFVNKRYLCSGKSHNVPSEGGSPGFRTMGSSFGRRTRRSCVMQRPAGLVVGFIS